MQKLIEIGLSLLPMVTVMAIGFGVLGFLNQRIASKSRELAGEGTFRRQMVITFFALFFIVALIVSAPLEDNTRGNLISLFGIALTGVIALSSTTLASNARPGRRWGVGSATPRRRLHGSPPAWIGCWPRV